MELRKEKLTKTSYICKTQIEKIYLKEKKKKKNGNSKCANTYKSLNVKNILRIKVAGNQQPDQRKVQKTTKHRFLKAFRKAQCAFV